MGVIETFGGPNRAIWGLFWDVVVAWGNLEAFRAFLGYLGAIGAIWGCQEYYGTFGPITFIWGIFWDYSGLQVLARVFQGHSGAM